MLGGEAGGGRRAEMRPDEASRLHRCVNLMSPYGVLRRVMLTSCRRHISPRWPSWAAEEQPCHAGTLDSRVRLRGTQLEPRGNQRSRERVVQGNRDGPQVSVTQAHLVRDVR